MKNKKIRALITTLTILTTAAIFAGCGNSSGSNNSSQGLSGSLTVLGSTALQPLAEQAAKGFTAKNPNVSINVQGGGSGAGINQVSSGAANIGMSDVTAEEKLKDAAKAKELTDHEVCVIGFAVVTSKDVKIDSLTKAQIQDIFSGKITNWKDLGGEDQQINVINRPASSGTRATFVNTLMGGAKVKEDLGTAQDSSGAVRTAIKANKGSISYLALSYITDEVKGDINSLKIDGAAPNKENITSNKYPFWSYEHMYTKGEAAGSAKAFIDYIISAENKTVVEKLGYIPLSEMK